LRYFITEKNTHRIPLRPITCHFLYSLASALWGIIEKEARSCGHKTKLQKKQIHGIIGISWA